MKFQLANAHMNNLLDPLLDFFAPDFFDDASSREDSFAMSTDVHLEDGNYVMEMELPGFRKEDIRVSFKDGYLTIKATRESDKKEDGKKNVVRRERFYGSASRSFYVGDIDETKIKASYQDGILSLTFPSGRKEEPKDHLVAIE